MIDIQRPTRKIDVDPSSQIFAVRLMEHLVVPTFVLDSSGRVIIWNRACERLTGLSAEDVVGTADHWRGFYDAPRLCLADVVLQGRSAELGKLYAEYSRAESGEMGMLSAENWCMMPRIASRCYLAIDAGPIFSETGELLAVVETLRDITAQKKAQTALEALASLDGLTGIANRRMFDERLEKECRRAGQTSMPVSLLMIDIDHFKQFNDVLGHQRGDDCLRQVASLLSTKALRSDDLVARYGGEEFAIILPRTPLDQALVVADRILSQVESLSLRHPASETADVVTASIGVASMRGRIDPKALIAQADAALYRAKREGRNRATISTCPEARETDMPLVLAG